MPRSHNPNSYPTAYYRMVEYFSKSQLPFHIQCQNASEAVNKRNEWHSFVRALERHNTEHTLGLAKIARGRTCAQMTHDLTSLLWKSRDTTDYAMNLDELLDAALEELQLTSDSDIPQLTPLLDPPLAEPVDLVEVLQEYLDEPTPSLDPHAEELFDQFMSEAQVTIDEQLDEQSLLGLIDTPVKRIHLHGNFSTEIEDPNNVDH